MHTTVLEWKSSILPPVTLWFTTTEGDWCFDKSIELSYAPETLREKGHLIPWKKQEEEQEQECHVGKLFEVPDDTGGTYSKVTFRLSDLQTVQRHVFAAPADVTCKDKLESEGNDMKKRNSPHSFRYKLGGAVGLVLSWLYVSRLFFCVFHTKIEADKWEKALQLVITELKNDNEKISPIMKPLDASLDPPCQGELLMRKPDGKFQRYYVVPSKHMKGSLRECAYVAKQVIYFSRHRRKWVLQVQKSLGLVIPSGIDLQYTTISEEKSDGYIMFLDVEPYIPNWRANCGSSLNMRKKRCIRRYE
ncbi:hypothetical protein LSM04_006500 [Trypanosoma melophagium]|uniref:uncharacterized protein n=1 Tax=Trypanosoma melophagium TaxID=715481 RepID=UPI00351A1203|nr:hypothetical protein LSM04_006500 [Trypanosoma melophagium]